jgi:hypothetical protein
LHLLMALPINFLHHPLPGTQTKTSVTFGCGYLTSSSSKKSSLFIEMRANISCTNQFGYLSFHCLVVLNGRAAVRRLGRFA